MPASGHGRVARLTLVVLTLAVVLAPAACSGGSGTAPPPGTAPAGAAPSSAPADSPARSTAPAPSTRPPSAPTTLPSSRSLASLRLRLHQVATLEQPLAMALAPDGDALYIAEKPGRVVVLRGGRPAPDPVLDLRGQVADGTEQGLLGIAVPPGGRHLYVDYTDRAGDTHVVEYRLAGDQVVAGSRRELLFVDQPFANHNGGQLAVGPDGALYVGLGDGGGAGDPYGNAQSLRTLLGKILRVDPRPDGGHPYRIPPTNPFARTPGARPEIWAYGLRNPWRFSFDPGTGDLWIGDVGQGEWEEIDHQPGTRGGVNYGWNLREGNHAYGGAAPPGAVGPVTEYRHPAGFAVIGGFVYRGVGIPGLRGAYVYGDAYSGFVRALRLAGGRAVEERDLGVNVPALSSFGVDRHGELYTLSLAGPVYRLTG